MERLRRLCPPRVPLCISLSGVLPFPTFTEMRAKRMPKTSAPCTHVAGILDCAHAIGQAQKPGARSLANEVAPFIARSLASCGLGGRRLSARASRAAIARPLAQAWRSPRTTKRETRSNVTLLFAVQASWRPSARVRGRGTTAARRPSRFAPHAPTPPGGNAAQTS